MKTLAAIIFSALSFTAACAVDETVDPIDKPTAVKIGLEDSLQRWAGSIAGPGGVLTGHLDGDLGKWAARQVGGISIKNPLPDQLGGWAAEQIISGTRPVRDPLHDQLGGWAADHVVGGDRSDALDGTLDGSFGDWAEQVVIGSRIYDILHGKHGAVQLLDDTGEIVMEGRITGLADRR